MDVSIRRLEIFQLQLGLEAERVAGFAAIRIQLFVSKQTIKFGVIDENMRRRSNNGVEKVPEK